MPRSYGGRPLADRRAERRDRFREAGLELFGTTGFAQVTISALCAEAGLSRRQFYEEYSSSEDLLLEIYDLLQADARDRVMDAVHSVDRSDLDAVARATTNAYLDAVAGDPRYVRCLFVEIGGVSQSMERHRLAGRTAWAEYMAAVIAMLPTATREPLDYQLTAYIGALVSVVHRWATASPRPDREEIVDLLAGMLARLARGDGPL